MEIAWGVTPAVVGILLTIAFSAVGYSPAEFRLARWCLVISALVLGGTDIVWQFTTQMPWWWRTIVGISVGSLIFIGLPESLRWVSRRQQQIAPETPRTKGAASVSETGTRPPTLLDLFKSDFPNVMKYTGDRTAIQWNSDKSVTHVLTQNYLDFPAKAEFIGFYVKSSDRSFETCMALADAVENALKDIRQNTRVTAGDAGGTNSLQDLTFSGRIFLYHEDPLTNKQRASVVLAYDAKHYDVQLRGPEYLGVQVIAWHHKHDKK